MPRSTMLSSHSRTSSPDPAADPIRGHHEERSIALGAQGGDSELDERLIDRPATEIECRTHAVAGTGRQRSPGDGGRRGMSVDRGQQIRTGPTKSGLDRAMRAPSSSASAAA